MSTYKNSTAAKTTVTRNTSELFDKVDGNLFEAIVLLTKRSNQISREMKEELTQKLEEFGGNNDNLEEVFENR
ncbi:MAG: DNA-directed RNA polymerase subunit omega, partial [Flavobacteriales bacterium]